MIERIYTLGEGTLHAATYADTYTMLYGQRIGKRYRYVKGQLEEDNFRVAACPCCLADGGTASGIVVEVWRDPYQYPGSTGNTAHMAVCLVCRAFGIAKDRNEWQGVEAEAIIIRRQSAEYQLDGETLWPVYIGDKGAAGNVAPMGNSHAA